ncbi:MAG: hypothetical protein KC776_08890 [Myxococcales bacterium]|nr:hypothetical protein [Myxococcales bacterium]MCB9578875.1 hypothetical protein [Polyangiaceae bacterium]
MALPRRKILIAGLLGLGGLVTLAAGASAQSPKVVRRPWHPPPPPRPAFSMQLESPGGSRLETFRHGGQTWVLGEQGDRYVIVVNNPTSRRVEAVVTVDGRDVITGRRGNFVTGRGYVVPPFGSTRIEGFRTSLDSVATFRFTDPESSYSSRMGTPQNVGVIGVAFFPEREAPVVRWRNEERPRPAPTPKKSRPRAGASRAPSTDAPSNIGTEFGEERGSHVREVSFVRQSNSPARIITLRYDDARGLEARGIQVFRRFEPRPVFAPAPPQAFPDSRFAPPPP